MRPREPAGGGLSGHRVHVETVEAYRVVVSGLQCGYPLFGARGKTCNTGIRPDLGHIPIVEIPCQLFVRAHGCLS